MVVKGKKKMLKQFKQCEYFCKELKIAVFGFDINSKLIKNGWNGIVLLIIFPRPLEYI